MDPHYYANVSTTDGAVTDPGTTDDQVPAGTTVLTKEQYDTLQAVLAAGGHCALVSGVLIPTLPITQPSVDIASARNAALLQIDTAAETARAAFMTTGSGQALEYQATAAEASLALAATGPLAAADYPWLQAELLALASVGQTVTLLQVAQGVAALQAAWVAAGAAIKTERRSAKLRVAQATNLEAIAAIITGLNWPTAPP